MGSRRAFSTVRSFAPDKIIPSGHRQVRVINNTVRDAQQSNLSAEMADEHRHEIAKLINDIYKDIKGPPGYEQTWGGTVPMFDIWKRGVHPFESLRKMTTYLPNTPASALIRSNSLTSMSVLPKDVVDGFIRCAAEAGVDVFTNFDAHNDWRNHVAVAEAVHKYGKHYQAAISWAVYNPDATIYNVQWAVHFFKQIAALKPHSLYVKDPSGVLTPEIAGYLAASIKEAFPDLPLVFHSHYQTGFAYMSYLKAVENGANGVECSLGLADGAAQPFGLSMLRAFEEMGWDTGNPNKAAMQKVTDFTNGFRNLYAVGKLVRVPDIRVEDVGIAGGQRTILDKELRDVGQAHLIPLVNEQVQRVRDEGGKVCQVTPVADSYAREAMRRLRGGDPNKNFAPGYAAILTGENGLVKEPVDPVKQKQALLERVTAKVRELETQGVISAEAARELTSHVVAKLRDQMWELSQGTVLRQRKVEVSDRIEELQIIKGKDKILANLNRAIANARAKDKDGKVISNVNDRIRVLQDELSQIDKTLKSLKTDMKSVDYENLLKGHGKDKDYESIIKGNDHLNQLVQNKKIDKETVKKLVAHSGVITCCSADLLPPALPQAEKDVLALDKEFQIGLTTEGERALREATVLQASFRTTAIAGLITNFFKSYRTKPDYWGPLFEGHDRLAKFKTKTPPKKEASIIRRGVHDRVAKIIGSESLSAAATLRSDIRNLEEKLQRLEILGSDIGSKTKDGIKDRIKSFEEKYTKLFSQALEKVQDAVKARPGVLSGSLKSSSSGAIRSDSALKEELKMAEALLREVVALEA